MTATRRPTTRRAATLAEVMVALALTLGIMVILTEAFKMSLDFVRSANSTGVMMYQLNGAGVLLARDLGSEHFLADDDKKSGGVRLSDQRFDLGAPPPRGGFFRLVQGTVVTSPIPDPLRDDETVDDSNTFAVHTRTGHSLHFTAIRPGGAEQNVHTANVGGTLYTSPAAEVAWFLVETGQTAPGGRRLCNLVRRYRLVATNTDEVAALNPARGDTDVISVDGVGAVNTLDTIRNTANRMALTTLGGVRYGEDIVLANVLSFEVLADWTGAGGPRPFVFPSGHPQAGQIQNSDAPYDTIPVAGGVFDSHNATGNRRIKSLQITIRIYDPRMKQTRQNTWQFAM